MVDIDRFRQNLPAGWPLPELLIPLVEFQNSQEGFYCGYFYIYENGDELLSAYFGAEAIRHKFGFIGMDEDGSVYAFWFHDPSGRDHVPIVYLEHDAVLSTVLANDFNEFLSLLGSGIDRLGRIRTSPGRERKIIATKALADFRDWLGRHGLQVPRNPKKIISRAVESHPDLLQWIERTMRNGKSE